MFRKFLLVFFSSLIGITLSAQNRTLSGTVISSEDNLPLPGVTVVVENTTVGTATDIDGKFSIPYKPEYKVLIITFVGMKTQRLIISNSDVYNVVLHPDVVGIEEVVVTVPYGVQKKETFTGSLGLVQSDQLDKQVDASIDKMLQGAVAGIVSTSGSGQPGSQSEVRIRGIGSMNASSDPLYVIDGIPVSPSSSDPSGMGNINILATLNPSDIESVSVLKDASATSLYGSRASNGVIMITTKKGAANKKTSFSFSTQQGISTAVNSNLTLCNSSQYIQLRKEAIANAGSAGLSIPLGDTTTNTNWLKKVFGYGYTQNYEFSANGGNDKTSFFVSGSYKDEKGIVINTSLRRMTGRVNLSHKANDKLTFGTNITMANTFQHIPHGQNTSANEVVGAYLLAPNIPVFNSNGSYNFGTSSPIYNVIGISNLDNLTNNTNRLLANGSIEYKFNQDFKFKSLNGLDYIDLTQNQFINPLTPDGMAIKGLMIQSNIHQNTVTSSNIFSYDKKINEVHSINVLVGYEMQYYQNDSISAGASNFPSSTDRTLSDGTNLAQLGTFHSDWALESFLSNLQYNYKGKYYFSGSFRRDGSSRFSNQERWSNFWSAGFSWRISDEDFMKQFRNINSLRFHTSYGTSGNSEVGNYASQYLFAYNHNYNNQPGGYPIQMGNPDLTWEKNNNADAGLDFRVYERFSGSIDVYDRKTYNLLMNVPISATNGFSYELGNAGEMVNKGLEVTLSSQNIKDKAVSWNTDFNIALNRNQITKLNGGQDVIYASQIRSVGSDFNTFYLPQWAGVDPADGSPLWYDAKGNVTKNYANARYIKAGNADPKFVTSLTNTFKYKKLSLTISLYCSYGNKIYDNIEQNLMSDGAIGNYNQSTRELNSWQKPGDITDVPKIVYNNSSNSNQASTRYLYDGSYIRLKNVMLSYVLPERWTSKLKLTDMSVYVQGQNLWTWTRFPGIDPEQNIRGVAKFNYPNSRTVLGGLSITL